MVHGRVQNCLNAARTNSAIKGGRTCHNSQRRDEEQRYPGNAADFVTSWIAKNTPSDQLQATIRETFRGGVKATILRNVHLYDSPIPRVVNGAYKHPKRTKVVCGNKKTGQNANIRT